MKTQPIELEAAEALAEMRKIAPGRKVEVRYGFGDCAVRFQWSASVLQDDGIYCAETGYGNTAQEAAEGVRAKYNIETRIAELKKELAQLEGK